MSHWFFDAPPAERQAMLDDAQQAVRDTAKEMARVARARKPDPREGDYRAWKTMGMFCVPVVRHSTRATTIEISVDGASRPHAFLNPQQLSIQPESAGNLLLIVIGRKYANWVKEKPRVNLYGVPQDLVGEWSEEDRKVWDKLRNLAMSINSRIDNANYRRSIMTRNDAA